MAAKTTLFFCAAALLIQDIFGVYIDPSYDRIAPWARTFLAWREANTNVAGSSKPLLKVPRACQYSYDVPVYGTPYGAYSEIALPSDFPTDALIVTSSSNGPIGVSILSENVIKGLLAVGGELPFLGSVSLEGVLPTTGSGTISYSSGANRHGPVICKELNRPGSPLPY
ncbi:chorion protein [Danaus plexippus plexippus]|uniref:Chorion protein n=1 Tax=Danaus plexippus plexippus TaxID=278856 RepID=A0A212FBB2_DANPL|nr:chorion protein [Danaus plexippus plexippus]